jgi:WhiB family transcriptional regulator, redox-sensing transcriptional regulator
VSRTLPHVTQAPWTGPDYDTFAASIAREKFALYLLHGEAVDGPVDPEDILHRPEWMAESACRDEDRSTFFVKRGQDVRPARAICARCPVRVQCLEYALTIHDLEGIWAGTSPMERRRLRRQRKAS